MTKNPPEYYKKEIKKITRQIVKKYKPEKIILFGSFAWGKPTKDSDVDLLIIKKTNASRSRRFIELEEILLNRAIPIDFLIYNPEEMKQRLSWGDFFLRDIAQKGKIIYEK